MLDDSAKAVSEVRGLRVGAPRGIERPGDDRLRYLVSSECRQGLKLGMSTGCREGFSTVPRKMVCQRGYGQVRNTCNARVFAEKRLSAMRISHPYFEVSSNSPLRWTSVQTFRIT